MFLTRYRAAPAAVAMVNPRKGVKLTIAKAMSRGWEKSAIPKTSTADRNARNCDRSLPDATMGRGRGCGAVFFSRRKSQSAISAMNQGMTASQKISRIPIDERRTRAMTGKQFRPHLHGGNPKALPRSALSTDFERIASRRGCGCPYRFTRQASRQERQTMNPPWQ